MLSATNVIVHATNVILDKNVNPLKYPINKDLRHMEKSQENILKILVLLKIYKNKQARGDF